MRWVFELLCVCALGVQPLIGCNGGQGADALVVQTCERAIECYPDSKPPWTVDGCVDLVSSRMQCLSPSEKECFNAKMESCLLWVPCNHWSLSRCPPGRLPPYLTDAGCVASLSDYCAGSECPTYSEAVAEAECDGHWEVGTCGDFRYVRLTYGFGDGNVEYFDALGALVAREHWTDVNSHCCGASFSVSYGPVPDCQREPTLVDAAACYEASLYCMSNCPLQEPGECTEQYLSTGSCGLGGTGGDGGGGMDSFEVQP